MKYFFLICLTLVGCSSVPQKLDPDKFYRRDLAFCEKSIGCFEGTAVLPFQKLYAFEIAPKGDAVIDLLVLNTCHREESIERPQKSSLDSFKGFLGLKKEGFRVEYVPTLGVEDDGDCTVRISTFEKEKGRHAWSVVRLKHEKYALPATLYCNGQVKEEQGVSICQSKAGLSQRIQFQEPVMIEADKNCAVPKRVGEYLYEWPISLGECGYTIRGRSGMAHDLLAIGFEGLLVRHGK